MVLLEFSLYPTDKGASVSEYVGRNLEIIDDSGLPYKLGPMGTCLEGEYDQVMAVVKQCFERMTADCGRVACQIKIDYRQGHTGRLEAKVQSLKDKTGRNLRT
jgi:uncharacterized protein (TIGR00106 family)